MNVIGTANLHYVGKVATGRYALPVQNVLNQLLDGLIVGHKSNVGDIAGQQHYRFPPVNQRLIRRGASDSFQQRSRPGPDRVKYRPFTKSYIKDTDPTRVSWGHFRKFSTPSPPVDQPIDKAADETEKTGAVEDDVSAQRPPGQCQSAGAGQRAGADHEDDVEDGRADDRADADVAVRHEHSYEAGEQLRGATAGRHQRRARHVLGDAELQRDDFQRRDEVLVADDGETEEHVDSADDVQNHGAVVQLRVRKQIYGVGLADASGRRAAGKVITNHWAHSKVLGKAAEIAGSVASGNG